MNTVLLYVVSNRETRALDHDLGTMTSLKFFAIALLFTSDTTHYILSTWTTCMFNYIFFLIANLLRTIRKPEQNIPRAEGLLALSSQHCSWLWESSCVAGVTETPCPWTFRPHILWLTRFLAPVCSLHFTTGCQSFRCLGASQGNDFFFSSRHPFLIFWPLAPSLLICLLSFTWQIASLSLPVSFKGFVFSWEGVLTETFPPSRLIFPFHSICLVSQMFWGPFKQMDKQNTYFGKKVTKCLMKNRDWSLKAPGSDSMIFLQTSMPALCSPNGKLRPE